MAPVSHCCSSQVSLPLLMDSFCEWQHQPFKPQNRGMAYSFFSEVPTCSHLQALVTRRPLADARSLFYPFLQPPPVQTLGISP